MTIVPQSLSRLAQLRDGGFHWRGKEPSRIEGLSDAVFGFAITLLVVSLEVPATFSELRETMSGFFSFALSFAVLAHVWYRQYVWFRRYGLDDLPATRFNLMLLFVVLFYVYPLKFLFRIPTALLGLAHVGGRDGEPMLGAGDWPRLMVVFSIGFAMVYGTLALLHWHAWKHRAALQLNALERAITAGDLRKDVIMVVTGLTATLLALAGLSRTSGAAYVALFALQHLADRRIAREVEAAKSSLATGVPPDAASASDAPMPAA